MGKSNKRKNTQKSNDSNVSKGRTKKAKHQKGFKKQKVII